MGSSQRRTDLRRCLDTNYGDAGDNTPALGTDVVAGSRGPTILEHYCQYTRHAICGIPVLIDLVLLVNKQCRLCERSNAGEYFQTITWTAI